MCYFFTAKLLVTTGFSYENDLISEVIDLCNNQSISEDFTDAPYGMWGGTGALVNNKPMVCGGKSFHGNVLKKCFVLGENIIISMNYARYEPSSIVINNNKVEIMGQLDCFLNNKKVYLLF